MTEETTIELFDSRGQLRSDYSDAEVEALAPEHREKFFALVKAATDEKAAEQEVRDAETDVADCVSKLTAATEAHCKANPPPDRIDALRAVIAAQNAARR